MERDKLGLETYRRAVSDAKRAAILQAARQNFFAEGYTRAAMAEIARQADVSTATLYKHFSSKEVLFGAVVEDAYSDSSTITLESFEGQSAREALHKLFRIYVDQQFSREGNALLRAVIAEVPSAPQLAGEVYERSTKTRYRHIQDLIEKYISLGELKPHDPQLGTKLLSGMVKEFFIWPALFGQEVAAPENIDELVLAAVDTYLARYGAA